MKKMICMILSILMVFLLVGCGTGGDGPDYKVALVQQLDHTSMDEIRKAIEAELQAKASESGVELEIKVFNGQNDPTVLGQIGTQVASDQYDIVIPIGTLAAQYAVNAVDGMDIPVAYSAISYPENAGLTGFDFVTGTCDALDTELILDMMLAVNPELKSVGLLYSNSEPNSERPVAEAVEYLTEKGIEVVEKTGNTNDEVITAAGSLVGRVDAVFTPTDNVVMAAAGAVAEIFADAGIPYYTGADSFVTAGAFATCGVNYTELGTKTAQMAFGILTTMDIPKYHVMEGKVITVNTETAQKLGVDYSAFSSMSDSVKQVVTGE